MTQDQDGSNQPNPGASPPSPPPPTQQERPIEVAGKPWAPRFIGEEVKGSQGDIERFDIRTK
jgi:hypothetical protein